MADLYPVPQDWAKRAQQDPFGWADRVRCIDLGNAEKVLSDALNGVAWVDDSQLHRIVLDRAEPDGEARVEVRVEVIPRGDATTPGLPIAECLFGDVPQPVREEAPPF